MSWHFSEYRWRLLPGGVTALLIAALFKLGTLQPLENITHNALFKLRGSIPWDDRLVLVAIDDASIRHFGRFPWSRRNYAQLLRGLDKAEPSVIVFNLLFSESTSDDTAFVNAIAQSGRVILSQGWDSTGMPLLPVSPLREASLATGHISIRRDADGLIRRLEPQVNGESALGVAAVGGYSLSQAVIQPPDLSQPLWLNWAGTLPPQYSFADVVQGQVADQAFRNKIVLVGVTATGIEPQLTPFPQPPTLSGVHLQATLINNLLQGNALKPVEGAWLLVIFGAAAPGFGWLISYWRTEKQVAIAAVLGLGWVGLGVTLLKGGYLLPVALPLSLLVTTTVATIILERLRMNVLLQQQVQQLWQIYQSDLVTPPRSTSESSNRSLTTLPSMQRVAQLAALAEQFGRSQSTQATIARSLSVGLVAANLDGLVWFCNPVASDWLKVQPGGDLALCLVPAWVSADDWAKEVAALHTDQPKLHEVKRGSRWVSLKLEPLTNSTHSKNPNQLYGILLLLEDITDRKQVEDNLGRQVHELNRMSQLKDEFLSTVSHELRTPLTNIKMAIQLLKISKEEVKRSRYLEILDQECTREAELINNLLDLQRLESGAQITYAETICLQDWLPSIIEPFYKRTEARQQSLAIKITAQLPDLLSDRLSLERILVELVNNACKYTPPAGAIVISADWSPPHIELTVANSGIEIPEKELPLIFERFYRVPQSDPWKQGGTGLGLALVKKLVERLGGNIQVKSGGGSTRFVVQMPLQVLP